MKKDKQKKLNDLYKQILPYKPLIKREASLILMNFKNVPLTNEDLEIWLMSKLVHDIEKFDPNKGVTLGSYIKMLVKSSGINYCRKFSTNKFIANNYASTSDEELIQNEDDYMNSLKNELLDLIENNEDRFNHNELVVLKSYLDEEKSTDIMKKLNKSKQSISRYKNSAEEKLFKLWQEAQSE